MPMLICERIRFGPRFSPKRTREHAVKEAGFVQEEMSDFFTGPWGSDVRQTIRDHSDVGAPLTRESNINWAEVRYGMVLSDETDPPSYVPAAMFTTKDSRDGIIVALTLAYCKRHYECNYRPKGDPGMEKDTAELTMHLDQAVLRAEQATPLTEAKQDESGIFGADCVLPCGRVRRADKMNLTEEDERCRDRCSKMREELMLLLFNTRLFASKLTPCSVYEARVRVVLVQCKSFGRRGLPMAERYLVSDPRMAYDRALFLWSELSSLVWPATTCWGPEVERELDKQLAHLRELCGCTEPDAPRDTSGEQDLESWRRWRKEPY